MSGNTSLSLTLVMKEALVNAMYHRSYELREPVEVRVNPDGIVILSYPGPDPSIKIESWPVGTVTGVSGNF
jgi:ATP-dependent DNA helicase RecG